MDEVYMKAAIAEAKKAALRDEVPVGAVIVKDGKIVARAHNLKEQKNCANFHAETVAIERACKKLGNWYLEGCELYVTLEPCPMCCGAVINARVERVCFGAYDPKAGAVVSLYTLLSDPRLNHTAEVKGGVLETECAALLADFFKRKREEKKSR